MNAANVGNTKFQAFLEKKSPAQAQPPAQDVNPQDAFIASVVGAEDQKACGYGGSGGGGCR